MPDARRAMTTDGTERTVNEQIECLRALALCQHRPDDSQLLCEAADTLEHLRDVIVGTRPVPRDLLELLAEELHPPPAPRPAHRPGAPTTCASFVCPTGGPGAAAYCAECGWHRRHHRA